MAARSPVDGRGPDDRLRPHGARQPHLDDQGACDVSGRGLSHGADSSGLSRAAQADRRLHGVRSRLMRTHAISSLARFWFTFESRVDRSSYFRHGFALMVVKYLGDAALIWAVAHIVWTPL